MTDNGHACLSNRRPNGPALNDAAVSVLAPAHPSVTFRAND